MGCRVREGLCGDSLRRNDAGSKPKQEREIEALHAPLLALKEPCGVSLVGEHC